MQAQGSLRDTNLASLLQTMQSERATGTLSLEDSEQCALYFLFGHLFHASGAGGQGEDVVIKALGWQEGSFRFDPRAKLPAEETIKSPPADLITRAERREREAAASAAPVAAQPAAGSAANSGSPRDDTPARSPVPVSPPATPFGNRTGVADEARWGRSEPAEALPAPTSAPAATPEPAAPQPETSVPVEAYSAVPTEPVTSYSSPVETATSRPEVPATPVQPERTAAPSPAWAPRDVTPSPTMATTFGQERAVGGAPDAPPLDSVYPLPAGKKQYEGLKSAFVDFPKLLRTLKSDRHTGYVRLNDRDYSGSLLLHDGDLLEALSSNGGISDGEPAFLQFRRHMDEGTGLIDVIELAPDTVVALAQLLTARPLFTGLLGRFVDFNALLEYLAEEKVDGSVVVTGGRETGVILLRGGTVLGAYTASARQLDTKTNLVAALAKERPARIEVKSGAADVTRMDFEASLSRPY